ncbi:MAG: DUF1028 domain-containing protein [Caldilineaceae bacterium]|nr:DUF1028 domain-containing protein [Caldilineaceae bacterium]
MGPAWAVGVALAFLLATSCSGGGAVSSESSTSGTWSVVAVDADGGEVGVALATCVAGEFRLSQSAAGGSGNGAGRTVYQVYVDISLLGNVELARLLPGYGVIVAQAQVDNENSDRIDRAASRLLDGGSAQDAVAAAMSGDSSVQTRQYGVATLAQGEVNFTGEENSEWAGGVSGPLVSAQGNILVGPAVVSAAVEAFQEVMQQPGAVLADGLLAALEAGAMEGGDNRCPREQTAQSAFLAVARSSDEGDSLSRWLTVPPQDIGEENPVVMLRQAYDRGESSQVEVGIESDGLPALLWGVAALVLVLALASGVVVFWIVRRRRRRGPPPQ